MIGAFLASSSRTMSPLSVCRVTCTEIGQRRRGRRGFRFRRRRGRVVVIRGCRRRRGLVAAGQGSGQRGGDEGQSGLEEKSSHRHLAAIRVRRDYSHFRRPLARPFEMSGQSFEERIDGRKGHGFVQHRRMADTGDRDRGQAGMGALHLRHRIGRQQVRQFAAQLKAGDIRRIVPQRPQVDRRRGAAASGFGGAKARAISGS